MKKFFERNLVLGVIVLAVILIGAKLLPMANNANAIVGAAVDVWWPVPDRTLNGQQTLKAMLPNKSISEYQMYWQVDNGNLNQMYNSNADYPHKEAVIDVTSWNWRTTGAYVFNFVAKDNQGAIIAQQLVANYISPTGVMTAAASTISLAPSNVTQAAQAVPAASANPMSGINFYVNHNSQAAQAANNIRNSWSYGASQIDKIAAQPTAEWIGNWNTNVESDVRSIINSATSTGSMATLVAYNIPQRDCGGYSSGGSGSPEGYKQWINAFARGIGNAKTTVILEPDALAGIDCLSQNDRQTRLNLLSYAIDALKSNNAATLIYLDAGHPGWKTPDSIADLLNQAGLARANGFSLNVSNFISTSENITYGTQISQRTHNKHFVIDTGRNGNGSTSDNQWCNPGGRALGRRPTAGTGNQLVDAYLWLKTPGASDGWCSGGTSAGTFWNDYAVGLAERAQF